MAWMSAAALVGGQLLSSKTSANAAGSASDAQVKAADAGLLLQNRQQNIAAQAAAPYQQAGQEALGSLMGLLGLKAPKMTTPYGYSKDAQNLDMSGIYGMMGLGGAGHMLAPPPERSLTDRLGDPGNLLPSDIQKPFSEGVLNSLGVPGGVFGGLAHGGHADGGNTYVVGEEGPEILHMAPGSQGYVDPNPATKARMAMGHRMYGGPVGGRTGDPIPRPPTHPMPTLPPGTQPRAMGGPVGIAAPMMTSWPPGKAYPLPPIIGTHPPINPLPVPPGTQPRAFGGPVFGGNHMATKWSPGAGYAPHAHLNPLGPTMHMGYRQMGEYGIPGRATGGPVGNLHPDAMSYANGPTGLAGPSTVSASVNPAGGVQAAAPAAVTAPKPMTTAQQIRSIMAQDPGYKFRLNQGIAALDTSAAAQGGLFSGGHGKALTEFGQNYASQEYNNIYNRLAAVAGIGQTTNAQQGYLGAEYGQGMAGSAMYGGNAAANGIIGTNNAYQTGMGNLAYLYGAGAFGGGGGGGSSGGGGGSSGLQPGQLAPGMYSDRRLKTEIQLVGTLTSGLPVYTYKYRGSDTAHMGVMADEAIDKFPDAVSIDNRGYFVVDYSKIG